MNRYHRWYCASKGWAKALEKGILPWAFDGIELGDDALEIGPGPGLTTDLIRQRVDKLTCLEIDSKLATKLEGRMAGTNVTVLEGDGTAMPFEDSRYTSAISLTMLHHIPSSEGQDALFREACRVLKPGGTFVGIDSTPSFRWNLMHILDTRNPIPPSELGGRLEAAGFTDVEIVAPPRGGFKFRASKPA